MKLHHRLLRNAALLALGSVLLTGCVVAPVSRHSDPAYRPPQGGYAEPAYPSGAYYPGSEPGYGERYADVRYGTVAAIEPLGQVRSGSSGAGAVAGGLIGGLIGHEIGRNMGGSRGDGRVGAVLGAVGGAVIGDQVERDGNRGAAGWRVWIRLDDGGDQTLQMPNPGSLRVGERVRFVNGQLQRQG